MYSTNGFRKSNTIIVNSISKKDGVVLPQSQYTSVIWVNRREYPIIFKNAALRDAAFDELTKALDSKTLEYTLDLEMFYMDLLQPDKVKQEIKTYNFNKHLTKCIEYILGLEQGRTYKFLTETDAFKDISYSSLKAFKEKKQLILNNEQLITFSKTLRYPKEFQSYVSPMSFWTNLYELRTERANLRATAAITTNSTLNI